MGFGQIGGDHPAVQVDHGVLQIHECASGRDCCLHDHGLERKPRKFAPMGDLLITLALDYVLGIYPLLFYFAIK